LIPRSLLREASSELIDYVEKSEDIHPALERAVASGKPTGICSFNGRLS